jgi:hypothetical protein
MEQLIVLTEFTDNTYLHGIVVVPRDQSAEQVKELIDDAFNEASNLHDWSYDDVHRILRNQGLTVINDYEEWREPR